MFKESFKQSVNKIKETGSGERKRAVETKQRKQRKEELLEELTCFQKERLGTPCSVRDISSALSVSKTFIQHMVKRKGFRACKCLTTLHKKVVNKNTWKDELCFLNNLALYIGLFFSMNVFIFLDLKMILTLIVCFIKVTKEDSHWNVEILGFHRNILSRIN